MLVRRSHNVTRIPNQTISEAVWEIAINLSEGNPRTIIASGKDPVVVVPTGRSFVLGDETYTEFTFTVMISEIILAPGNYWMNVSPDLQTTNLENEFYNSLTLGTNQIGIQSNNDYFQYGVISGDFKNLIPLGFLTSNGVIGKIQRVICLHQETLVQSINGNKKIMDIVEGDFIIDHKGTPVKVLYNIYFGKKVTNFVRISENSLDNNVPSQDILIRKEHPILYKGKTVDPLKLSKKLGIQDKIHEINVTVPTNIYSLCTEEKTFVMMQGLPIQTWSNRDWIEYSNKSNIQWFKK